MSVGTLLLRNELIQALYLKGKKLKIRLIALAIISTILISGSVLSSTSASAAVCTTAICAPNPTGVIDMRRPITAAPPVTICEILNNPIVDVVIQFIGGVLKVNWVVTLVPTVVCRLVG